ncbi:MAG TPA: DUF3142 domain-containing protein [Thermoanaerobaculia bacterium]|jgi:hypothetical protein
MRLPLARFSIFLIFLLAACRDAPHRAAGPLRQEAYVWQRSWTPAVQESVRQAKDFAGVVVLAAEADLRGPAPQVVRVPLDGEALRASGRPVGAAVRATAFPGRFADDPRLVRLLQDVVQDVAAEARRQGISLSEVQIDYDCPESKLEDYRDLLPALRKAASPVPLTITVLPTWIRQRRAFRELIQAADGYVLQLHSLVLPEKAGERVTLIEPRSAQGWAEEAARFRRPFRAALPTYGYEVVFDARGKPLGVLAEGLLLSWSPDVTVRTVRSDPKAMAGLIHGWTRDRPAELAGVLWYRLPVVGDRLNWTWPTLRAVMTGRAPRAELRAVSRHPEPGLVEVDLLNAGEAEAAWPSPVRIRWDGEAPSAADGLAVYQIGSADRSEVRLKRSGAGRLRPGERRTIAWLRFATPTEVRVELP